MCAAERTAAPALGETPASLLAHTASGRHDFDAVALVYIHVMGVGIQPFVDGFFFSWVSGLTTILHILFAFIMQMGLYLNHM